MDPSHNVASDPRAVPPKSLFKYLAPERVTDVLEDATLKFTELSNTNDIFEVRRTFERIAGPRFRQFIASKRSELTSKANLEDAMMKKLAERLGRPPNRNERRLARAAIYKGGLDKQFREEFAMQTSQFADHLNTEKVQEEFLQMFGRDILCLSLSEGFGIAPMWAHYAANHSGFVVEFATDHDWFKSKSNPCKSRLHKVHYFDGILDEVLENPEAAFGSKTAGWSYEREWRMYCGPLDIERTIPAHPDAIHLKKFPRQSVKSVIIGSRSSDETVEKIKSVTSVNYPDAIVHLARPNRRTSLIELGDI